MMRGTKAVVVTIEGRRVLKGFAFNQYALGRLLAGCIEYHAKEVKRLQAEIDEIIEDDFRLEFITGAGADPAEIEAKLRPLNHQLRVNEMKAEAYRFVDKRLKAETRYKANWLGDPMKCFADAEKYMLLHPVE